MNNAQKETKLRSLLQIFTNATAELSEIINGPAILKGIIGTNFKVTASSDDGNIAANVLDGDFTTRWSAKGAGQFLTLELPDVYEVDSIQLAIHEGDKRKQKFELFASVDGVEYQRMGNTETSGTRLGFESFTFAAKEAKFLRIFGNMNSTSEWNSITGVRVNDPEAVKIPVSAPKPEPVPVPEPKPEPIPNGFIPILSLSFENHPIGPYTDAMWKSDWGGGNLYDPKTNTTRIEVIQDSKKLVSHYPKGTWGRGGGLNQIVELKKFTNKNIEEAILSYDIIFQEGFDFGLGGKLPGFGFGPVKTLISGGKPMIPTGGATGRNMWDKGKIKNYIYAHGMKGPYGDNFGVASAGQFIPGKKSRIELRVKANDLGKANGVQEVKQDGKVIMTASNIEFRIKGGPQFIEILSWGTFMGGGDLRFAPSHTQWMAMDNIEIKVK